MRDARLKGRAPRAHVNCWEDHLFHSHQRSKIVLHYQSTLSDFGIKFKKVPLLCDNESAIKLTNNLVQNARTNHIDVRHHFIKDHQQKGDICIESVGTEDQLADIFIKPLDEKRYELNILDFSNIC